MKSLLLLSLLTLAACAPKLNVEESFAPYVAQFKKESKVASKPLEIKALTVKMYDEKEEVLVSEMADETLATCFPATETTEAVVTVNPKFWNNPSYSNAAREQVLFHELSHCVLEKEHVNDTEVMSDGSVLEKSITNETHLSDDKYTKNHAYYMKEMFGADTSLSPLIAVSVATSTWIDIYPKIEDKSASTDKKSVEGLKCSDHKE